MPLSFSFDASTITAARLLERGLFSKGSGPGVDDPLQYSAVAATQSIATPGGVDVVAVTLVAGQTYTFDIDDGYGDSSSIDLRLDLINQAGMLVAYSDNPTSADRDPRLTVSVNVTGTYYIAVHESGNDYVDGSFRFEGTGSDTGDYSLVVSTPTLPALTALTSGADTRTYTDTAQRVAGLAGNDTLYLRGGNDIALGGDGDDRLWGGLGSDELSGGAGIDRLYGEAGADVLNGGTGNDILDGGADNDSVNGGAGDDLVRGGDGADFVWGDSGNDSLYGDAGNDRIRGGAGIDRMSGGAGADTFHFLAGEANYDATGYDEDLIRDFDSADLVDLTDLAWGELAWRGTGAFTGAFQVRINDVRGTTGYQEVQVNLDADAEPELAFLVTTVGNVALTQSDFLL